MMRLPFGYVKLYQGGETMAESAVKLTHMTQSAG